MHSCLQIQIKNTQAHIHTYIKANIYRQHNMLIVCARQYRCCVSNEINFIETGNH